MPGSRSGRPLSKGRRVLLAHGERRALLELARARIAAIAHQTGPEAAAERDTLAGAIRGLLAELPRHL